MSKPYSTPLVIRAPPQKLLFGEHVSAASFCPSAWMDYRESLAIKYTTAVPGRLRFEPSGEADAGPYLTVDVASVEAVLVGLRPLSARQNGDNASQDNWEQYLRSD